MKVYLGGTFDPIHCGHLAAAHFLAQRLNCKVSLVPCAQPALNKTPQASAQQRREMLAVALDGDEALDVDTRELERDGPSYTVDTLAQIRSEFPQAPLVWAVGSDALPQLHLWERWEELLNLAHLVVVQRSGLNIQPPLINAEVRARLQAAQLASPELLEQSPAGGVWHLVDECPVISSSEVRDVLSQGEPLPSEEVPDGVLRYIQVAGLYGVLAAQRSVR